MTVIKFRPRYDVDPGELKLVRVQYFLTEDRRRALWDDDVRDVHAADESLQAVQSLLKTVKEENLESWKQCLKQAA
jgi:hypothetical protein